MKVFLFLFFAFLTKCLCSTFFAPIHTEVKEIWNYFKEQNFNVKNPWYETYSTCIKLLLVVCVFFASEICIGIKYIRQTIKIVEVWVYQTEKIHCTYFNILFLFVLRYLNVFWYKSIMSNTKKYIMKIGSGKSISIEFINLGSCNTFI